MTIRNRTQLRNLQTILTIFVKNEVFSEYDEHAVVKSELKHELKQEYDEHAMVKSELKHELKEVKVINENSFIVKSDEPAPENAGRQS